jgi:amino acid transporter
MLTLLSLGAIGSRISVAMSLDGILPRWFSDLHPKYRSPYKAIIFWGIIYFIFVVLFNIWEGFYFTVVNGYLFGARAIMGVTAFAAFVSPITRSALFDSFPVAKFGKMWPIISLVAFIEIAIVCVAYMIRPELGLTARTPQIICLGSPLVALFWYLWYRNRQMNRGMNIDLAYKEIPPE